MWQFKTISKAFHIACDNIPIQSSGPFRWVGPKVLKDAEDDEDGALKTPSGDEFKMNKNELQKRWYSFDAFITLWLVFMWGHETQSHSPGTWWTIDTLSLSNGFNSKTDDQSHTE
jgi:hypothetical protein